jgi:hypothetical protein
MQVKELILHRWHPTDFIGRGSSRHKGLTGTRSPDSGALERLERLQVSQIPLDGTMLMLLGEQPLPRLVTLEARSAGITGLALEAILTRVPSIEWLDVSHNPLHGDVQSLVDLPLPKLVYVNLSRTRMTSEAAKVLANSHLATQLGALRISDVGDTTDRETRAILEPVFGDRLFMGPDAR